MVVPRFTRRLAIFLVVLLLLAAAVLVLVYLRATSEGRSQIEIEAAKSMLQIMAVAIVGGVVGMLVREHEELRKAEVARSVLLRTDLTVQLAEAYTQSKQVRRLLRVATDPTSGSLEYSKYAKLLGDLSDIQLKLERLKQAADAGASQAIVPDSVPANLQAMERYLGALITEYDSLPQQKDQMVMLANRPRLSDFTAKAYESTFKERFSNPFHLTTRVLRS